MQKFILKYKILNKHLKIEWNSYIIMRRIIKFVENIMRKESPKPMGRWNLDYCNTKLDKKIDLSNEDHCGPCGQYAITKSELKENRDDAVSGVNNTNNK